MSKSPIKNDTPKKKSVKDKAKSSDELLGSHNSPRNSKDFTTAGCGGGASSGSLGFSGFDSDRAAHPLPRPSISSMQSLGITDHHGMGVGSGSGSGSVSSCSSGSSDDHATTHIDQGQISTFFRFGVICTLWF